MCGIYCCISCCNSYPQPSLSLREQLERRGPDNFGETFSVLESQSPNQRRGEPTILRMMGTVLQLRGERLTKQPYQDKDGNILLWNGEVFEPSELNSILDCRQSDTVYVAESLRRCSGEAVEIHSFLNRIRGPFALVYYDQKSGVVFFARDALGRRSLVWTLHEKEWFIVCSVATDDFLGNDKRNGKPEASGEVPVDGLFRLKMSDGGPMFIFSPWISPWSHLDGARSDDLSNFIGLTNTKIALVPLVTSYVTFSDYPGNTERRSGTIEIETVLKLQKPLLILQHLSSRKELSCALSKFEDMLRHSIRTRVDNAVRRCKTCDTDCPHSKIAILFSGGIDSMIISYLAGLYVPEGQPIDLLNVACSTDGDAVATEAAPDRVTGRQGHRVLCDIFPDRVWNFVTINVSKAELDVARCGVLWKLLLPRQSVLDCSIGSVLWFAAKGTGLLNSFDATAKLYTSPARVLLSGLGADELLGGYSRHRTCFHTGGNLGLQKEMLMDIKRIGNRNCGRDDRVISDHGREVRYPFLDEALVHFLVSLPLGLKCDLRLPRGVGDKLLLRLLAFKFGLKECAVLEKRAMQFGTRIAKLDKTKNGHDMCVDLTDARLRSQTLVPAEPKSFEQ